MATASLPRLMTADELAELPDDGTLYELSRGVLVCMSPASFEPGRVGGRLMRRLFAFVDEHQLGECGSGETGFLLSSDPDTVCAPDAWFIRAARIPAKEISGFFPGPPDLAVEVISPSDRFDKLMLKIRDYLAAGTPLVWALDPRSRVTAVFRPGQPVHFLDEDGVLEGEDVLPGFALPLRDVFG
jgi:Uma2 family endonuclease